MHSRLSTALLFAIAASLACSKSAAPPPATSAPVADAAAPGGVTVMMDLSANLESFDHFFDFPWPSDLRLTKTGSPDIVGLPDPLQGSIIEGMRTIAEENVGFPVVPVAWFQFTDALATRSTSDMIPAAASSPLLLVDVDPTSATRGALTPTIAQTLVQDSYVPANVLAIGPLPGFILEPKHQYAYVVMRSANDASGAPLGITPALFAAENDPSATDAVSTSLAPLWPALAKAGVTATDVAAATVFTTGDVVQDLHDLSESVRQKYPVQITNVTVDPTVLDTNDRMCELQAQVTYPQFQSGSPPYDTGGLITIGSDGLPVLQGQATVPVTFTVPKQPMPAGGFPTVLFFHGTGGASTAIADRGVWHPTNNPNDCAVYTVPDVWNGVTGCNTPGQGPGWTLAARGFAEVASSLPVDPQRWPAGQDSGFPEWININNVAPTRDIFRQGVIEQRLLIDALPNVSIPPATLAACSGLSLPAGETAYHFNTTPLMVHGQSMGAMYANLIGAVEPRIKGVVATGSGGYWSYFILLTQTIPNIKGDLQVLLDTPPSYTHLHPIMHLAQMALGPIDPMLAVPRLAQNPLAGATPRAIYEPHGYGDSYFPPEVQNAMALAYGNREAGNVLWTGMQDLMALGGTAGTVPYPVSNERMSRDGTPYTGVVVQYLGDGIYDPHAIYSQLDAVKYQYGCFFETLWKTGKATVPEPALYGVPCAGE